MFDKIAYISDTGCTIKLVEGQELVMNLMNLHLIFEDKDKTILGEVDDLDGNTVKARFLGEIKNNTLISGTIRKPSLDAKIRVINQNEIPLITGSHDNGYINLGVSPFYDGMPIYLDVDNFFSNHFAIFGNTGSGKSCGVSRLFQNLFHDEKLNPYKSNIFIFDSSGEYYSAFNNLSSINSNYNYRFISTNEVDGLGEKLRLPIYLLNKDDLALLLRCDKHSQLPIIERMLKLAYIFNQEDMDANAYKNHIIAKAIMNILYSNETAPNRRNEVFSVLASCSTKEFNMEAPVTGIGYTRKFRECFLIDNSGNFSESVLLNEYVSSFIKEEYDYYEPKKKAFFDLDTLEKALNFTLISEGWLRNEQTYGDAVSIRVKLHALIVSENSKYFDFKDFISIDEFISSLLIHDGKKYQIVNINLNDVDDEFAKSLTKVYSRVIFDYAKALKDRGSIPFHLILEEAHRYIQNDSDRFLFGYNIFERIAKEGRKYGVVIGIITQRPIELSDNVISQCTNFLIFKINHPVDVEYIRKMVPNITDEIIEKQKSLQSGTCLGFGLGFKIPLIVKMEMPNPSPLSGNCNVVSIWSGSGVPSSSGNPVKSGNVSSDLGFNSFSGVNDFSSFNDNVTTEERFDDSFVIDGSELNNAKSIVDEVNEAVASSDSSDNGDEILNFDEPKEAAPEIVSDESIKASNDIVLDDELKDTEPVVVSEEKPSEVVEEHKETALEIEAASPAPEIVIEEQSSSVPAPVVPAESAPVEVAPAPVDAAPVEAAPVVPTESSPVETAPAPVDLTLDDNDDDDEVSKFEE